MEILILVGGRPGGHTDRLCHEFIDRLPEGYSHNLMNVSGRDISHCTGCDICKGGEGCRYDDDMVEVFEAFDHADVIVFATPLRFNGPSSFIKVVMDRFQAVWNGSYGIERRGRPMGLIMTAGSDFPDPNPNLKIFRSFSASFGGSWFGHVLLSGTDGGDVDHHSAAMNFHDQLIRYLTDSTSI